MFLPSGASQALMSLQPLVFRWNCEMQKKCVSLLVKRHLANHNPRGLRVLHKNACTHAVYCSLPPCRSANIPHGGTPGTLKETAPVMGVGSNRLQMWSGAKCYQKATMVGRYLLNSFAYLTLNNKTAVAERYCMFPSAASTLEQREATLLLLTVVEHKVTLFIVE